MSLVPRPLPLLWLLLAAGPAFGGDDAWSTPAPAPTPAASASTPGGPTRPEDSWPDGERRQLNDAVEMLRTRNAEKAQDAQTRLDRLAGQHPESALVQYNLGLAAALQDKGDEARRYWARATELDPAFGPAWAGLASLSARIGRVDLALANLETGSRYAPQDVALKVARVEALRQLKRYDEAVKIAREGLLLNSREVGLYAALGGVYLESGKVDLARFIVEKALNEIPEARGNADLHALLGRVYLSQGYEGDALQSLNRALDLDPFHLGALQRLGSYYLDNRNFADAVPIWERVIKVVPSDAGARTNLGIAYRGAGRFDEARACYEQALRLEPANPAPYRNIAVLQGDYLKDYDGALRSLEAYKKAGGGPVAEVDAWATALQKDKKRAEDKAKKEAERKAKEAEQKATPPAESPPAPAPTAPAPSGGDDNPWGGGG